MLLVGTYTVLCKCKTLPSIAASMARSEQITSTEETAIPRACSSFIAKLFEAAWEFIPGKDSLTVGGHYKLIVSRM